MLFRPVPSRISDRDRGADGLPQFEYAFRGGAAIAGILDEFSIGDGVSKGGYRVAKTGSGLVQSTALLFVTVHFRSSRLYVIVFGVDLSGDPFFGVGGWREGFYLTMTCFYLSVFVMTTRGVFVMTTVCVRVT